MTEPHLKALLPVHQSKYLTSGLGPLGKGMVLGNTPLVFVIDKNMGVGPGVERGMMLVVAMSASGVKLGMGSDSSIGMGLDSDMA